MVIGFGLFLFVCVLFLPLLLPLLKRNKRNIRTAMNTFFLIVAISVFLGSWLIIPHVDSGFVIIETPSETRVVDRSFVPYGKKISYAEDITVKTEVVHYLDNNRKVVWDVSAKLDFIADYDQTLNLIIQFGSHENWMAAVQKALNSGVNRYITKEISHRTPLPSTFSFALDEEDNNRLAMLGYQLDGKITAQNVRIVHLPDNR
jgi:hypothetical protein